MKTRKGYVQGYNAQAAVTEEQIILAAEVTQEANDVKQLHSTFRKTAENLQSTGVEEKVGTALADAGYWSEANVEKADPDGPELLIATTKDWKQRVEQDGVPPRRFFTAGLQRPRLAHRPRHHLDRFGVAYDRLLCRVPRYRMTAPDAYVRQVTHYI